MNTYCIAYLEGTLSSEFLSIITFPTRLSKKVLLLIIYFSINKRSLTLPVSYIMRSVIIRLKPLQKTVYVTVFSNSDQSKQNLEMTRSLNTTKYDTRCQC